jgi:hypothetical protein
VQVTAVGDRNIARGANLSLSAGATIENRRYSWLAIISAHFAEAGKRAGLIAVFNVILPSLPCNGR